MPRSCHHRAVRARTAVLGLALALVHAGVRAQDPTTTGGLTIDHDPPGCVAAEKYAQLSACFRPDGVVARGRVYFRSQGAEDWFYVEMTGEPPCLQAVLPRPQKDLAAIEYSISGMDRDLTEARTAEYTVPVTQTDTCRAGTMAPVVESAAVVIGSTSGTAPAGFLTGGGIPSWAVAGIAAGATLAVAVVATRDGGERGGRPPSSLFADPDAGHRMRVVSGLRVPGGRGQIVVDGGQVVPILGGVTHDWQLPAGLHHVEAVLLEAQGEPGLWCFDLTTPGLAAGSLRVVAGVAARLGGGQLVFQMAGKPGERVGFTFRVEKR